MFLRFRENKVDFQVLKIKDLSEKVIPLFQSISLQGVKNQDFFPLNQGQSNVFTLRGRAKSIPRIKLPLYRSFLEKNFRV